MTISEAMKAKSINQPFLTREKWRVAMSGPLDNFPMIQPTDSPDGCLYYGPTQRKPSGGWQPRAEDLSADDWSVTNGV